VPDPPDHWFEPIADHLGRAYLRYSFTKGTAQEVGFLWDTLGLRAGQRLLDVGCGPGRHAHAFGARGLEVVGIDISQRFIDLAAIGAPAGVTFRRLDARRLDYDSEFDAAVSLCQGAFGLVGPGADQEILAGIRRALRPGGRLAVSAFSSYFQVRQLDDTVTFDADTGIAHEHTVVKDEGGVDAPAELWTTCYTPRELRLLIGASGLEPLHVWSVEPGRYRPTPPAIDSAEFLVVARRPGPDGDAAGWERG
jgi:SAM-dependent methyltransferase